MFTLRLLLMLSAIFLFKPLHFPFSPYISTVFEDWVSVYVSVCVFVCEWIFTRFTHKGLNRWFLMTLMWMWTFTLKQLIIHPVHILCCWDNPEKLCYFWNLNHFQIIATTKKGFKFQFLINILSFQQIFTIYHRARNANNGMLIVYIYMRSHHTKILTIWQILC